MIERERTENPLKHQISLYWPEGIWIKIFFFPYSSLLGPGGTILQDELSALQNYLRSGYNKRWVPARTPDMSTSHPCRGVGILTSGLVPFCQDWKPNTPDHHQGSIPRACLLSDFWDEQPAALGQQILRGTTVQRLLRVWNHLQGCPKAPGQPLGVRRRLCRFPQGEDPCISPQVCADFPGS